MINLSARRRKGTKCQLMIDGCLEFWKKISYFNRLNRKIRYFYVLKLNYSVARQGRRKGLQNVQMHRQFLGNCTIYIKFWGEIKRSATIALFENRLHRQF